MALKEKKKKIKHTHTNVQKDNYLKHILNLYYFCATVKFGQWANLEKNWPS